MSDQHKPTWAERQQEKLLEKVGSDRAKKQRLERSWFGRMLLTTAERGSGSWEPELEEGERVCLKRRAERVTWVSSVIPGWLVLTDRRLVFTPVLEAAIIPWGPKRSELPVHGASVRRGLFLSRGIHMKPFWIAIGYLPGLIHIANLKVKSGRKAWWIKVEEPERWRQEFLEAAGAYLSGPPE